MGYALPQDFVAKMERLLGEEYERFMQSYDAARFYGIRVNTLKIAVESFEHISPFSLRKIPWAQEGFYVHEEARPGKHPYYHAGLYYIQEPSAMAPVELLDIQQDDRVLDLCAAPGGKSTQIAAKLAGTGLLVTNDNHPDRTKALAKNIELYGVRNAVVLNAVPEEIARTFANYFDKILIDAPCSGEGMFRKDEDMAKQWAKHSVEKCVLMQRDILRTAARLLAPGGRIVYSTCTFSPEENEAMIAEFLEQDSRFHIVPIGEDHGFAKGQGEWIRTLTDEAGKSFEETTIQAVNGTGRLWPHRLEGEGHFLAVLQHDGTLASRDESLEDTSGRKKKEVRGSKASAQDQKTKLTSDEQELVQQFMQDHLITALSGEAVRYGQHVYMSPVERERLDGLKVVRPGFFIGTLKKNRFEPAHPLATALRPEEVTRWIHLSSSDDEIIRYLRGETLTLPEDRVQRGNESVPAKGYALICVDGYSVGWGKWLDGMLKNEYPAGWRWT
ncbi:rRNA cytosine-C5-methyltransferase [Paenibacillus selenitireducens]|uniref:rRNA cytosine-C5-methyltransferase n=1 Tax=Paenibacillus selenitireducens TaxID=1324314 RepID=A0A1T2XMP5_9BACL|nr:RsmB/NOP family class I SAM-dependent RNA methyltransferase [Paenibacillus selenitireducens]OPA81150.1 rRNA cytosine-C5-methyltransferase [Paenibacillus selenitireducens]